VVEVHAVTPNPLFLFATKIFNTKTPRNHKELKGKLR
jgi:hypothetical protein